MNTKPLTQSEKLAFLKRSKRKQKQMSDLMTSPQNGITQPLRYILIASSDHTGVSDDYFCYSNIVFFGIRHVARTELSISLD